MANDPAKNDFEPLSKLSEKNILRISTHQTFLLIYRQRLQALLDLFDTEIQKLKQSIKKTYEVIFRRSKYHSSQA
jgi:hypothetical protein